MTTVVIHNNTVYADGQSTADMITSYNVKKVVNVGSAIIMGCGRWSHVKKFHQWCIESIEASNAQQDYPYVQVAMPDKMVGDDFTGAVLYHDGTIILFEGCDNFYEVEQPIFMGSGSSYAAGAIYAGASGEEAIEIASRLDPYTGGEIQIESFEEEPEELSREQAEGMSKDELLSAIYGDTFPSNESLEVPATINDTKLELLSELSDNIVEEDMGCGYVCFSEDEFNTTVKVACDGHISYEGWVFKVTDPYEGDIHFARTLCDKLGIEYKKVHNTKVLLKFISTFVEKVVGILNME